MDDLWMDEADLDSREVARARRRDRDLSAEARDLMRPGMGKVFKQIQDAQRRLADGAEGAEDAESKLGESPSAGVPATRRRRRTR
jgi:uncharacterized protein YigA (DUF484 family)